MIIEFTKMQGLGNDFVVVDATARPLRLSPQQIQRLADRHFGVGCDQVLLVQAPRTPGTDFHYRIFNADGGEVEQCGNGARCFVRYVRERGLTDKNEIVVETAGGIIRPRLEADGRVTVDMGAPRFNPIDIPFITAATAAQYDLDVADQRLSVGVVSMGNPHAVLRVDSVRDVPVAEFGPLIEHHPRFPKRVNAGFMEVVSPRHIRLRVYERGAGETLACGTGACAAVAVGRRWGVLDDTVSVDLPGGGLTIQWDGDDNPVWMTGPAERVFEGRIEL
ncbi:MAG: diaminopimelate epimerase [Pseudomonadota bacterium]